MCNFELCLCETVIVVFSSKANKIFTYFIQRLYFSKKKRKKTNLKLSKRNKKIMQNKSKIKAWTITKKKKWFKFYNFHNEIDKIITTTTTTKAKKCINYFANQRQNEQRIYIYMIYPLFCTSAKHLKNV